MQQEDYSSIAKIEDQLKQLKTVRSRNKATRSQIDLLKTNLNKLYASNKKYIMEFEQTNFKYIAMIRSTNNFYKIFGHSALYYTYSLAPKLNLRANLQSDNDFTSRSNEGFISIKDPTRLTEILATLDIVPIKIKNHSSDFIVYQLPWTFTKEQLKEYNDGNITKMQKFNHSIMVDNTIPVLFINLEELLKAIYENVRGMANPVEKETFGYSIINDSIAMLHLYLDLTNGKLDKLTSLTEIKKYLKTIKYQIKLIADLKIWTSKTCGRIGEITIKVQDIIEHELIKI